MLNITVEGIEYRFLNHIYAVSQCGKVLKKLAPYNPPKRQDGYVALGKFGLLHRAVALLWIPNPTNASHVHHINHDKTDNRVENLEWLTPKQHFRDRHKDIHGKHTVSEETKAKLREYRLGRITSEETKQKQRLALLGRKRPFIPRALHTQEWKDRMSLNHHKNASCRISGVFYRSFAEASRLTGIHRFTIRKRCLSKNFPEYELIPPIEVSGYDALPTA